MQANTFSSAYYILVEFFWINKKQTEIKIIAKVSTVCQFHFFFQALFDKKSFFSLQ